MHYWIVYKYMLSENLLHGHLLLWGDGVNLFQRKMCCPISSSHRRIKHTCRRTHKVCVVSCAETLSCCLPTNSKSGFSYLTSQPVSLRVAVSWVMCSLCSERQIWKSCASYLLPVPVFLTSIHCLTISRLEQLFVMTMGFSWCSNIAASEPDCINCITYKNMILVGSLHYNIVLFWSVHG